MIIGTRDSRLAMRQTEMFIDCIRAKMPDTELEVRPMKSSGDLDLSAPLDQLQGFGAFVRELDAALISEEIDVSVNSMKDMPVVMPPGLCVAAVMRRADVCDVILPLDLHELPHGAKVGTSSIRRKAELTAVRPDIVSVPLRGNIQTRLSKLDSGEYDSIILAKAGLDRLSADRVMHRLPLDMFVPAPAQGAIAVVCRSDDRESLRIAASADDGTTRAEVTLEREIMRMLGAGCSSPVGINASATGAGIRLRAVSFEGTPVRLDMMLPSDYTASDITTISNRLKGVTK